MVNAVRVLSVLAGGLALLSSLAARISPVFASAMIHEAALMFGTGWAPGCRFTRTGASLGVGLGDAAGAVATAGPIPAANATAVAATITTARRSRKSRVLMGPTVGSGAKDYKSDTVEHWTW